MAGDPSSLDAIADALGESDFPVGGMSSPDGAVTLVLSALDGCPGLLEALGEAGAADFLRNHRAIVAAVVGRHGGEIVKVELDAVMASFASAHAAVRAAIELQRAISELHVEPVGPLRLRAGVHTGFVIASGQAVFGRNVVIAARVADHAAPGEILVSAVVHEYTSSDASLRFAERGSYHFRGVHGEHELLALDWE